MRENQADVMIEVLINIRKLLDEMNQRQQTLVAILRALRKERRLKQ